MVAHHGINNRERAGIRVYKGLYLIRLGRVGKKSGIDSFKLQSKLFIMLHAGTDIIRQVAVFHVAQTAGMRRKHRGWDRADLHAHRGQRRNHNRKRTSAESGKPVNRGNSWGSVIHKRHLFPISKLNFYKLIIGFQKIFRKFYHSRGNLKKREIACSNF